MKIITIAATAVFVLAGMTATAGAGPLTKCKACHTLKAGGKNKTGPNLFGIVGRTMGSTDYKKYGNYLKAQKDAGAIWDTDNLRAWLASSQSVAKAAGGKTRMPSQKLKGKKADAAIAALEALQSSSIE